MKFTVIFVTLISISWAIKLKKVEDPKDKREAAVGYASSHGYPLSSLGHDAGGAGGQISIGAGYSFGGAKPSFSFGLPEGASLQQLSSDGLQSSGHGGLQSSGHGGLQSSGHGTIQLSPITLQPGQSFGSEDLHQLMSQISQGLSSGAISLPNYQTDGGAHGGQELSAPQLSYGAPSLQQYSVHEQSSVPSYAAGSKGLGSYSSTGPVLFNPSDSQNSQASHSYAAPATSGHAFADTSSLSFGDSGHSYAPFAGHSLGDASLSQAGSGQSLGGSGHSFGGSGHSLGDSGHSFGDAGHSFGGAGLSLGGNGYSLGGSGHSIGGSGYLLGSPAHSYGGPALSLSGGHSLGSSGLSLGGSGHSFGGSIKSLGSYNFPGKTSFKPSAYVGSSSQGDSGHSLSALSGSHGAPSFGGHSFSGSHGGLSLSSATHGPGFSGSLGGIGGGSSKYIMQTYLPGKSESFPSFAAYSANAHSSSPPATTYGTPSASYHPGNSAHSASSHKPYYVMSKHSSPSFVKGSFRAPMSHGASSLSSYSSPKYSLSGHSSSSYPKYEDAHGSHSETSYNTIKYSEEMKPRIH